MKIIGLVGGMSWESSLIYYKLINEKVRDFLGGLHSAECIMYSLDFADIQKSMTLGSWEKIAGKILHSCIILQEAGADCIVICSNTIHKVVESIERKIDIPIIHIVDATAKVIQQNQLSKIALLGTKFTMEENFYKKRLRDKFLIDVIIPEKSDIKIINNIIFNELVIGEFKEKSRIKCIKIINKLKNKGAEGVILGCTEIPLLISQQDSPIPIFDTTLIHINSAIDFVVQSPYD